MVTVGKHAGRGPREVDLVVLGAGPAGAATCIAAANLNLRVLLVERALFPRFRIGETLPPKAGPLLHLLGVRDHVDAAGFVRMRGNASLLRGSLEVMDFAPGLVLEGYQVERDRFDDLLLRAAVASGAELVQPAEAASVLQENGRVVGVVLEDASGRREVRAQWVIDATGPAAWLSRRLGLRREAEHRTVAIYGYWRGAKEPRDFPSSHTLLEALREGWIWSLPLASGLRNVTLGVDAGWLRAQGSAPPMAAADRAPATSIAAAYRALLDKSRVVPAMLEGAVLADGPHACDASDDFSESYAGPGFLLVGDAGWRVDPLSSQGVVKALGSGLLAAAVVNTSIRRPHDEAMALAFFDDSEKQNRAQLTRRTADLHREGAWTGGEFWRSRMGRPGSGVAASVDSSADAAAPHGDTLRAFAMSAEPVDPPRSTLRDVLDPAARRRHLEEALATRGADGVRLSVPGRVVAARRPRPAGGFIELHPAVVDGSTGRVAFYPFDAAPLLESIAGAVSPGATALSTVLSAGGPAAASRVARLYEDGWLDFE